MPTMKEIADELKPCPFCGPGNSFVELYKNEYGKWIIGCGVCGSHSGTSSKNVKEDVVKAWNTRASEWLHFDTAPKDGTRILCFAGGYIYAVEWDVDESYWVVDDNKHGPFPLRGPYPSFWMPTPDPPKVNK